VEELTCRLLPWEVADGPTNMAADEALVRTAAESGIASLRFYGWSPATLSLGYFQPAAVRFTDPRLAVLPFVRRPSGGATLVHDNEVTYCIALPASAAWHLQAPWMPRMHRIVVRALSAIGLGGRVAPATAEHVARHGDVLCFEQFTEGDILCAGKKVVGSAQRKYRGALMQHGSILLRQSAHTPSLPGLLELTGHDLETECVTAAAAAALRAETGWRLIADEWTAAERIAITAQVTLRYATAAWNERR
jgi:lipoyl(octanoyl) transferase